MYSDTRLTPEQISKILGHPPVEEPQLFSNPSGSKDPFYSELVKICNKLSGPLESAVDLGMKGAPGYIDYPECSLRRQNICGPTADALGVMLLKAGIETEVVTVELPHTGLYSAPTHTFLKTVGDNPYIIDPSYIQFINGFEEYREISTLPNIAVFPVNDTENQIHILSKQIATYAFCLLKIKRLDPSYPVVRAVPLNAQKVESYLRGIWDMSAEGTSIKKSDYLSDLERHFHSGALSQLPPFRAQVLKHLLSE